MDGHQPNTFHTLKWKHHADRRRSFGALSLLFGRRLYWAFVAVAGFLVGAVLADVVLVDQSQVLRLLVAVAAGVIGAILAMLVQRVGFAVGGLYAGGYLAINLASAAGSGDNHLLWFCIGGLIGAVAAVVLLDWAIIVLSSLVGAAAIVLALNLSPLLSTILFVVLTAVGIAVQGSQLERRGAVEERRS